MAVYETSLCLEVAERPQWPRLYLLGRPRSRGMVTMACCFEYWAGLYLEYAVNHCCYIHVYKSGIQAWCRVVVHGTEP